jgi:hypothetical protein
MLKASGKSGVNPARSRHCEGDENRYASHCRLTPFNGSNVQQFKELNLELSTWNLELRSRWEGAVSRFKPKPGDLPRVS